MTKYRKCTDCLGCSDAWCTEDCSHELMVHYRTERGHGEMELDLDKCLPCNKGWMKKLLRVVDLDPNSDRLREYIDDYLSRRLNDLQIEDKERSPKYYEDRYEYKQKAAEHERAIHALEAQEKTCKTWVQLSTRNKAQRTAYKAQLAEIRKQLKAEKEKRQLALNVVKCSEQAITWLYKDIKMIQEDLDVLRAGR